MPRADRTTLLERVWYGEGSDARWMRRVLAPLSAVYAGGAIVRNAMYDAGVLAARPLALPAISVGNLSVGGTGKTPFAAWIAGELARRGARVGIVLRGYGEDEPLVHERLDPRAIVVANPDRVAGVARAAAAGADVAVLDDAFQHRRARRDADIVLVSADRWTGTVASLPAGPFREGLRALRRASMVVVTRKAAPSTRAGHVAAAIRAAVPECVVGRVHLAADGLVDVRGASQPLSAVRGRHVLAICGIGDPRAFQAQLSAAGATVTLRSFGDHHAFSEDDVAALVAEGAAVTGNGGFVVCTLKDAVKLFPRWPAGACGLSFLSQQVIVEAGHEMLDRLLDSLLRARSPAAAAVG